MIKKRIEPACLNVILENNSFVVLDIETSGLSPAKGGRIIEIGATKLINGQISEKFSQLINPEQKIYAITTKLTGITNEMLAGKPTYMTVLPEFHSFLKGFVVVAHNSMFDWDRFLKPFFLKVGINVENEVVNTLALSKFVFPNSTGHNLEMLCSNCGIPLTNHHRAYDDSLVTAKALVFMKNKIMEMGYEAVGEQLSYEAHVILKEEKNFYKIKRANYWERQLTKASFLRRIYILLDVGTVFFDINTRSWGNKDVKDGVNFDVLQPLVISYLRLKNIDDLCDFRGKK